MKIAAHITFYFVESRLKYLQKVVDNLELLPHNVNIFIYCNEDITDLIKSSKVAVKVYHYKKSKILGYNNGIWNSLGMTKFVHPYYLSWENRKFIPNIVDDYDIQIYLEDDIAFTNENLNYWLSFKDICLKHHYNLGFLRIEEDSSNQIYVTDPDTIPAKLITIEDQPFLINDINPYCGFWIYDRVELAQFIKSKEWSFKFKGLPIREKSAIGWHGLMMNRYVNTILPVSLENDKKLLSKECLVHHLPNNYIDHSVHCQIKVISLPESKFEMKAK
jgi:hypothetical protein